MMRTTLLAVLTLLIFGAMNAGCNYRENKSGLQWWLDMADGQQLEAQEEDYTTRESSTARVRGAGLNKALGGPGSGIRVPPQGTVPRGYQPYLIADIETAGKVLRNPLLPTGSVLARGQKQYHIYCGVCHGNRGGNVKTGRGNGSVIPRFPAASVPALVGPKAPATSWTDGKIFHIITRGRAAMLPYAAQVSAQDRWAIIHYIRRLQKAAAK